MLQLCAPPVHGHIYVNHKGFHSINVQAICDANCEVTHVFTHYPGFTHNSFILANPGVPTAFEGIVPLGGVADRRQWLSVTHLAYHTIH